jgi:hypothetical protein
MSEAKRAASIDLESASSIAAVSAKAVARSAAAC